MQSVIVHYQEIALKGRNRPWFVERLVSNIRAGTADLGVVKVRALMGRIELQHESADDWPELCARLARLPGIANFSRAVRSRWDIDAIADTVLDDLGDQQVESFRVSAQRADKRFPMTSPQIERELGGRIKAARGWRVDLERPELTVRVEILNDEAFCHLRKEPGPGGLPSGVSGRVACLMSGGIDSPVAAYRMIKRGCRVRLIHFHSYPILSHTSQDKVAEIAELLTRCQLETRLYMVAFGEIQRNVVLAVPPPLRVVVYRRLMLRIAERIGRACGAMALVTGEAVGQVASQTLENMAVINSVTSMPLLRPLVGMDKDEIVREARQLGTYEVSIVPDEDCCTLFTPKHPATKARARVVDEAEAALEVEAIVEEAATTAERRDIRYPTPAAQSDRRSGTSG
ncbi:MAG: tRNA uracil 4-sulfurtransferase ThiI [Vicinamibacterales bacterium]|jgi:thiamine biosynthesis protein ThiI|nr:tRNA uracil 4-sulfurtransferase ThiI [Vicinamibacterales bacterium]